MMSSGFQIRYIRVPTTQLLEQKEAGGLVVAEFGNIRLVDGTTV